MHLDLDGRPAIERIRIGGPTYQGNFSHRGDVFVHFTGPPDTITIELRRFTMAGSIESALDDFANLQLWAYDEHQSTPRRPSLMSAEADCTAGAWRDDCAVRVFYDAQQQLARSGADIRVTLPESYRGRLEIVTTDNDADPEYVTQSNVCIDGMPGSASVELENGEAHVRLARTLSVSPTCDAQDVRACDEWTNEDGEATPWASACPCADRFGETRVESAGAASIVIDVPDGLWVTASAGTDPSAGERCTPTVDLPDAVVEQSTPWLVEASTPSPGEGAAEAGGYTVVASSEVCHRVASFNSPLHFDCGEGDPSIVRRGDVTVCSGCLPGCDAFASD